MTTTHSLNVLVMKNNYGDRARFISEINLPDQNKLNCMLHVQLVTCVCLSRVNTGLAPGRKRAYMLYKAALTDASKGQNTSNGESPLSPVAPHPYYLALGVVSIQKVGVDKLL